jgi:GT2 family glycosyltransferase
MVFLAKSGISHGKNVSKTKFPEAWLFSIEIAKLPYKDGSWYLDLVVSWHYFHRSCRNILS